MFESNEEDNGLFQPQGFFNCSPAVDVSPNPLDADHKENDMSKPAIENGPVSKL